VKGATKESKMISWLKKLFGARVQAEELAQLLFSLCVLQEETTVMRKEQSRYDNMAGFQREAFQRQLFLYLVASVAIALTNEHSRRPEISGVIIPFRQLVNSEIARRWRFSEAEADSAVENASSDLGRLLYANPGAQKGISFEWPQEWLKRVGVTEYDPAALFEINMRWKLHQIHLAKMLSKFRIVK